MIKKKNYISRLDLVKLSIEYTINSLLKKSSTIKVGLVSFGSEVEVKGDCFSNVIKIEGKDLDNVKKIESLGEENTNLIKTPINKSSKEILKILKATEISGKTALGPAILLSLFLLNKAKIGSRIFLCTDGLSNLGIGKITKNIEKTKNFYKKIGILAKDKGIVISLITFEDSESAINILKDMVKNSSGEIIRVNPNIILDSFNELLENETIAKDVIMKMNLNKCMTFRNEEEKDLLKDRSCIIKKLGNVSEDTESYIELKFKKSEILAEMKEINFDLLNNLVFQCEINFTKKNEGKYIRIITKKLKISDNKEELEKDADFNIISTNEIQKSGKLAEKGLYREAQAQAHAARKYLAQNKNKNINCKNAYSMFNININSFNKDLEDLNIASIKISLSENLNVDNSDFNVMINSDRIQQQIYSLSRSSNFKAKSRVLKAQQNKNNESIELNNIPI